MGTLSEDLGKLDPDIESRINAVLHLAQTDVPTFLAFAVGGQFSTPTPSSLDEETNILADALKTYLRSKALDANCWHIILQLLHPYRVVGQVSETGLCVLDGEWYSSNSNAYYYLCPNGGTSDSLSPEIVLIKDVLSKESTTGRQLFDAAATCNGAWDLQLEAWTVLDPYHLYPHPDYAQLFNFSEKGFEFSCLSQLDVLCIT